MKKVLLIGGTGSWGHVLCKKLLEQNVEEIRIFNRNEYKSVIMSREFTNKKVKFIIGDIRDYDAVYEATKSVDTVFLLAALKHVPICEDMPSEAIKTNIVGVENVIKASLANNVAKVVDVSTDKACAPNTVYGATKLIGERLILNANGKSNTRFMCIRAGNVLGTAGSVVPLFIEQIQQKNTVTLTNSNMTRFFMTLDEAINLLITASSLDIGDLLVMKMPSCYIGALARVVVEKYGDTNTIIKEVGNRPNEKLHEMLLSPDEALKTYIFNDNYYLVSDKKLNLPKYTEECYSSNSQEIMSDAEILAMLKKGGF